MAYEASRDCFSQPGIIVYQVMNAVLLQPAMHAFRREVARLVDHPEATPFEAGLPKIFGLVQQLLHAELWIR
jgi:hypothetical protein